MKFLHHIIPAEKASGYTGASCTYSAESRHAALVLFNEAKTRLLNINEWGNLCHSSPAGFNLTDASGNLIDTTPVVGNLIRIRLPLLQGQPELKYAWARIENFECKKDLLKDEDLFGFSIRPVSGPVKAESELVYSSNMMSYFFIFRKASNITVIEHENTLEKTNGISIIARMKLLFMELLSALRLSRSRWKNLVHGILKPSPLQYIR